jgi:hypothetical protein
LARSVRIGKDVAVAIVSMSPEKRYLFPAPPGKRFRARPLFALPIILPGYRAAARHDDSCRILSG